MDIILTQKEWEVMCIRPRYPEPGPSLEDLIKYILKYRKFNFLKKGLTKTYFKLKGGVNHAVGFRDVSLDEQ